jgi:hypothetical protein
MVLQYRVSTTAFITTNYSLYNYTTQQISGTTGQNIQRIKVLLPAECDNKT